MNTEKLFLRCFAEYKDSQWSAVCLDLNLAAQADTVQEVIDKMESMIKSHIYDALEGDDKEFAHQLMTRKAPAELRAKYHYIQFRIWLNQATNFKLFNECLPLKLA